jgi:hypothetical protein
MISRERATGAARDKKYEGNLPAGKLKRGFRFGAALWGADVHP